MKPIHFLILVLILAQPCWLTAQSDAEKTALIIKQVDSLNERAFELDGEMAFLNAQVALELAQKAGYREGMSDSYVQLGLASKDDKAIAYYKMALEERLVLKLQPKAASSYFQIGNLLRRQGHIESAITQYQKGLAIMKGQPLHINTINLYNGLATTLQRIGNYESADSLFKLGVQLCEQLIEQSKSEKSQNESLAILASLRMNTGAFMQDCKRQYPPAKEILLKSLEDFKMLNKPVNVGKCLLLLGNNAYLTRQLKDAEDYYNQGIAMEASIRASDYYTLLKNRGRVFLDTRKFKAAKKDFQVSLQGFITQRDTPMIAATLTELGNFFYEQSELDSAIVYYRKALDLRVENAMLNGQLLYFLADALDELGQKAEAQRSTSQYIHLIRNMNAEQNKGTFDLLMAHQLDKNRILRKFEKQAKERLYTYLIIGMLSMGLLLLLALLFAHVQRQKRQIADQNTENARQQQILSKQNEEIARKNEQLAIREKLDLLKNKELETNYARLEGQDEMQKKIGQELHDDIGTMLASIKLNLKPVDEVLDRLPEDKRTQYGTANRLLDEASELVRKISHELSSAVLLQFGLKAQLEALAQIIIGTGQLNVELTTHGLNDRLEYKTEFNIYRMVQELIHNVIKHAQAQNVTIQVNRFENRINLIVEDDGRGFEETKMRQTPGLGMRNLEARVHDLGGVLDIDARPGRGAMVSIDIPV